MAVVHCKWSVYNSIDTSGPSCPNAGFVTSNSIVYSVSDWIEGGEVMLMESVALNTNVSCLTGSVAGPQYPALQVQDVLAPLADADAAYEPQVRQSEDAGLAVKAL
jgi:hypothetical protein